MVYIPKRLEFSKRKKVVLIVTLALFTVILQREMIGFCPEFILSEDYISSDEFRQLNIPVSDITSIRQLAKENNMTLGQIMALYVCDGSGKNEEDNPAEISDLKSLEFVYEKKQTRAFSKLSDACEAVFEDLKVFPVAECINGDKDISYSDTWFGERTFGGERRHEGTDIMASVNERGIYPILSMTDGVVENVGWLKLGGYRVGIRSPHGGYFYYAHLAAYAKDFKVGDAVKAGDLIGYMGDSGYGSEGTVGAFDVHLHLGIYIEDDEGNEISVNPYNVLKNMENSKKRMDF